LSNHPAGAVLRALFNIEAVMNISARLLPWRHVAIILLACITVSAHAAEGRARAAIATAHPLATEAGYRILEQGGNAFDAAVTIAAVLAVVEPYSAGLGGGGFWLLHRASDKKQMMIDARETAPAGVALSMYVDADGVPVPGATLRGGKAAGIPGVPAGMVHLVGAGPGNSGLMTLQGLRSLQEADVTSPLHLWRIPLRFQTPRSLQLGLRFGW